MNNQEILDSIFGDDGEIEKGKRGDNTGLPIRSKRLSTFIHGLQKARLKLLGGQTGTGKTAYVDDHLVFEPIEHVLAEQKRNPNTQLDILYVYYSMEITPKAKMMKIICRKIYLDTGILLDPAYIAGQFVDEETGEMIAVTPEHEALYRSYLPYAREVLSKIIFIDRSKTAKQIASAFRHIAEQNGTFEQRRTEGGEIEEFYYENNPHKIIEFVFDHIGLAKGSPKKATIDDISAACIYYRNVCFIGSTIVSQFNRGIEDVQRAKLGVEPQLSDFKETGNTQEDADHVIAFFHPYKLKIQEFKPRHGVAYNTLRMGDRFRAAFLLKNRHGAAEKVIALQFVGECGVTEELPFPDQMTENDYLRVLNPAGYPKI